MARNLIEVIYSSVIQLAKLLDSAFAILPPDTPLCLAAGGEAGFKLTHYISTLLAL